jgi:hypothetical protein
MSSTLIDDVLGHRGTLHRKLMIHTPAAVIAWGALLWLLVILVTGNLGALVGLTLVAIIAASVTFEASATIRDLRTEPITTRGNVDRAWAKGRFLFVGTVRYLIVRGRVFELRQEAFASLQEDDIVAIKHWPHTNIVISLHLLEGEDAEGYSRPDER